MNEMISMWRYMYIVGVIYIYIYIYIYIIKVYGEIVVEVAINEYDID